MRNARLALSLLVATTLAACGGSGATPTPSGASFDPEGSWQLVAANVAGPEVPILDEHPITLTIEGSEINGTAACNSYGGRLTVSDGRLEIGDLGMTAMGCEEPAMTAEAAYMSALSAVTSIEPDGEQLVLRGPEVELRFDALPEPPTSELVDTAWVLETIFVGDASPYASLRRAAGDERTHRRAPLRARRCNRSSHIFRRSARGTPSPAARSPRG